jgi:alpha-amylase/alpha-mannosidase (GH57 family)
METNKRLDVAFLWHMHQPLYKDTLSGKYLMPWVRLHGVKDYFPMAAILEKFENVKATFNLVPVLVEQINDYVENNASDTLLDLTLKKASSLTYEEKVEILEYFFRVNFKRFVEPNPRYSELLLKKGIKPLSESSLKTVIKTFSSQDFLDLQVLFNLSWFHSISIEEDINLRDLAAKGSFTEEDKEYVVFKQREILAQILPLYRRLQDTGRIEISTSPYYHPILPLLCDTSVAKASMPSMPLPKKRFSHPEDAKWHVEQAIRYYAEQFGQMPQGMWPSEGSVSDEVLNLLISKGIKWVTTDEDILFKSLHLYERSHKSTGFLERRLIYQPYRFQSDSGYIDMVFRDKNLSDIISFNYNAWDQEEAAGDLMNHFNNIGEHMRTSTHNGLVTIAMDGENAWEYFEDNARKFFETLYSRLESAGDIRTTTISGHLEANPPTRGLSRIFPASWINHNFEMWIGHEQDNESWDYLARARSDLAEFTKESRKARDSKGDLQKAWRELYIAEGSDWNWWYTGKLNSGGNNHFDKLYRMHLKNVYKVMKRPIPEFLNVPIS